VLLLPTCTQAADPAINHVALITAGKADTPGWDEQGAAGLKSLASDQMTVTIIDDAGTDDPTNKLGDLQADGAQLIICHDPAYATACADFSANKTIPVVVFGSQTLNRPNLVSTIAINPEKVAYLAGLAAAHTTRTGTVAVIASGDDTYWNLMTVGFAEGLKAGNGSAKLNWIVLESNPDDLAKDAKAAAKDQLKAGADVIFALTGPGTEGVLTAIEEHNKDHKDDPAWLIDAIANRNGDESATVLTSVLFDFAPIYRQMVADLGTRTFGKTYTMDGQNDTVRLRNLPDTASDATRAAIADGESKIKAGLLPVDAVTEMDGVRSKLEELGYR